MSVDYQLSTNLILINAFAICYWSAVAYMKEKQQHLKIILSSNLVCLVLVLVVLVYLIW
jgi:hypothetical protein